MEQSVNDQAPDKDYTYWKREMERAEKHFSEKFWPKADKLYKLYARQTDQTDGARRFAMLWSNTEVLKPSIYARPPIPQVSRRHKDKDPVGRLAADMLERACSYEFDRMNVDSTLRAIRDDLLLPGRGVAWLRYEAEIEGEGEQEQVKGHHAICDYIHYRQFLHEPVRRWEEVTWVAKIAYMSDKEGKARFGETWKDVELDNKADAHSDSETIKDPALVNAQSAKATVYEIWCKSRKKVYFLAKACKHLLAEEDPLLDFEGFFPTPRPVYATVTNNSLLPTPDYAYYQDQAEEIDALTARIGRMTDSLKLVGFYPAGAEGDVSAALEKALSPDTQSQMVPIASWAAFGERGGSNSIVWLPIREVAETIRACIELRNQIVQDVYQITGISDILRGSTEANETATAQSIKAQWGSVRIRDRQEEMARIARDITRMACEIIAEQFDPDYLLAMSNMQRPQPPQPPQMPPMQPTGDPEQDQAMQSQAQQAMQQHEQAMMAFQAENAKFDEAFHILRDDKLRGFRIDIETDSTIQPDEDAEKQRRTEFVTAIGGLMQQAVPMVQVAPELAGLIKETLLFTARGFRAGRQLEDQIEQALDAVMQRLQGQMGQQQQDPNAAANEAKAKQMAAEAEHKQQMWGMEREHTMQKNQIELQNMVQKAQTEIGIKQTTAQTDLDVQKQQSELGLNTGKAKLKEQILAEDAEAFMGQPGEQVNGVASVIQQAIDGMMQAMTQSNQMVLQSNQQLMQAMTAPKVITAPDGRQYTAQTALN
jgi:hypothetical protein